MELGDLGGWLIIAMVMVGFVASLWQTGTTPKWLWGAGSLPGFGSIDQIPFETMKELPNPVDPTTVLLPDQRLSLMRQFMLQQWVRNRQAGLVGGFSAFSFDIGWRTGTRSKFGDRGSHRHYRSILVVDLGVESGLVSIQSERLTDKAGKLVGRRDIEFGDPEFDRRFFVESQPRQAAEQALTPVVRHALTNAAFGSSVDLHLRGRHLLIAASRPGRQLAMVEAAPDVVQALVTSLPRAR